MLQVDLNSPLSAVLEAAWPTGFKIPEVKAYGEARTPQSSFESMKPPSRPSEGMTPLKQKRHHPRPRGRGADMVLYHTPWSIYAWEQLWDHICNTFQGNHAEPKDAGHLFAIKQASGESIRNFFKKFAEVKCQVKGVNETTVINAATCGL